MDDNPEGTCNHSTAFRWILLNKEIINKKSYFIRL